MNSRFSDHVAGATSFDRGENRSRRNPYEKRLCPTGLLITLRLHLSPERLPAESAIAKGLSVVTISADAAHLVICMDGSLQSGIHRILIISRF